MAAANIMLTPWSPDKKHSDRERFICIYPAYINSKKTRQEGRRLNKEQCVENPTFQEIRDVLSVCNLRIGVENKQYPRERSKELLYRGRIRVQLKNDDGTPCNPDYPTRDSILVHLGKMIPQLKTRQGNRTDGTHAQQTSSGGSSTSGGGGSGGGGNKKGKGKRR